ncbi:hypothetical protein [Aurantimonas sp. 22II-16-19i]|uniref:hypothetical protein n=1 Tax=Aurantimonas sp. 22II-16-19i TaxID=1317114 RepID=UPI0009F7B244|nr:hypothetical protein [Aurantimonas sp. 22II-16-19i]ORE89730.1 hypothetical protein ATO4_23667 [Aurantimonas sp. 22II-16-19i]
MAGETYYATGTASVGAGSTAVTGAGTSFVANGVQAGDYFAANGLAMRIASVNSNTSITLAAGWPGAALAAVNYEIRYTPSSSRVTAALNTLIALLGNGIVQALAGVAAAADRLPYFTGAGTFGVTTFTNFARTLLDDADAATARTTLGAVGATDLAGKVAKTGDTMTGNLLVQNSSPSISVYDTDAPDANGRWNINASYDGSGGNQLNVQTSGAGFGTGGVGFLVAKDSGGTLRVGLTGFLPTTAIAEARGNNASGVNGPILRGEALNLSASAYAAVEAKAGATTGQRLFAGVAGGSEVFRVMGDGSAVFTGPVTVGVYTTAARPSASAAGNGAIIRNATTGKLNQSNGTAWFDAVGVAA